MERVNRRPALFVRNVDFELSIARDVYKRQLPETVKADIRDYVGRRVADTFCYARIAETVLAVHKHQPMTIEQAIRALYPTSQGPPSGDMVGCALAFATH